MYAEFFLYNAPRVHGGIVTKCCQEGLYPGYQIGDTSSFSSEVEAGDRDPSSSDLG